MTARTETGTEKVATRITAQPGVPVLPSTPMKTWKEKADACATAAEVLELLHQMHNDDDASPEDMSYVLKVQAQLMGLSTLIGEDEPTVN